MPIDYKDSGYSATLIDIGGESEGINIGGHKTRKEKKNNVLAGKQKQKKQWQAAAEKQVAHKRKKEKPKRFNPCRAPARTGACPR